MQDLATAQLNWKTDDVINNSSDGYYAPAACCCWRYHTIGTQQGDWYVPAVGEWGYAAVRCQIINDTINNIVNSYGANIGIPINVSTDTVYGVSTPGHFDPIGNYSYTYWRMYMENNKWAYDWQGDGYLRAFCRLTVDGNVIH